MLAYIYIYHTWILWVGIMAEVKIFPVEIPQWIHPSDQLANISNHNRLVLSESVILESPSWNMHPKISQKIGESQKLKPLFTGNHGFSRKYNWLVVWTPLKNMKVSWDYYSNIWKNKKNVPVTTNQIVASLDPLLGTFDIDPGCEIVLGFFFWAGLGFFFGFLGWYHLPSVCNGLELEFVILHGICHIWACSPFILHGIYYMWACSPSILYGICHILACSPSILHGISYMWACSPSILYGICHILACSPSILHGMFYMWACSPKYLQMRKLGIR